MPQENSTADPHETTVTAPDTTVKPPALSLPSPPPFEPSIPIIHIVTEEQAPISSRVEYVAATLTVSGASRPSDNGTFTCRIRGRGHSSFKWTADMDDYNSKNSYRFKLDDKVNLLHLGANADRDWVLISGKYDASALRNYLIWNLAGRMGQIPYVPACTWVEVYLNGDYRGLYTLVEHIEVGSDRVNIDDSPSTDPAEVGYLLEYDMRGNIRVGAVEGLNYFYLPNTDQGTEWVIKSEIYTKQETAAIREHLMTCHEAILNGDRERMDALIDIPSFVDMFILQELSKNPDVGVSSFYVQRNRGGKLFLTAPWDFDFGFGTYSESVSPVGLVADGKDLPSHPWFEALVGQEWFLETVQARMAEVEPLLAATLDSLDALCPLLTPAADRNHERWSIYGEKYAVYVNDQASVKLDSYGEHIEFLINWTNKRWLRMEQAIRHALWRAH